MRLLLVLLLTTNLAIAEDFKNTGPIAIDSDTLEFDQLANKAIFSGNVIVAQQETKLYAEKLVVSYNGAGEQASEITNKKIDKIEAFGNIKFVSNDKTAYSSKAIYNMTKQTLEMEGNVKLVQNKSTLYGEKLVYDMKTRFARLISKQNKGRVKAVINKEK